MKIEFIPWFSSYEQGLHLDPRTGRAKVTLDHPIGRLFEVNAVITASEAPGPIFWGQYMIEVDGPTGYYKFTDESGDTYNYWKGLGSWIDGFVAYNSDKPTIVKVEYKPDTFS